MANSFVANVNKIAQYIDYIAELNTYLQRDDIETLLELAKVKLNPIKEDIDKGTFFGQRQIVIDMLKNYKNYDSTMTSAQLEELYNMPSNAVVYNKIEVTDTLGVTHQKDMNSLSTPLELYDFLNNWFSPTEVGTFTRTNVSYIPTEGPQHNVVVSTDIIYTEVYRSNVMSITLSADTTVPTYKEEVVTYRWDDTTSSIITVSNHLDVILTVYSYLDDILNSKNILAEFDGRIAEADQIRQDIIDMQTEINAAVNIYKTIKIGEVTTLPANTPASVVYDETTNTFYFSIPEGERGIPFQPDAIGTLADRATYDTEAKGFVFLSTEGILYIKNSNTSGDWGPPIEYGQGPQGVEGPQGPKGEDGFSYSTATTATEGVIRLTTDLEAFTGVPQDADVPLSEKVFTAAQTFQLRRDTINYLEAALSLNGYRMIITTANGRDILSFVKV